VSTDSCKLIVLLHVIPVFSHNMFNIYLSLLYNVVSVDTACNKITWDLGENFMLGEKECN